MSINIQFADYSSSTLAAAITALQTSIPVISAAGYPPITGGQYFYCTLADYSTGGTVTREVVKVTGVNLGTNILTVTRGAGGYTPQSFPAGALCDNRWCAQAAVDLGVAGSGAPTGLSYLTAVNETATLPSSRRLGSSARIAATDGGAGATFTYDLIAGTITNAYLSNFNANSILGNNTGAPAAPIYLTVAQTVTMLSAVTFFGTGVTAGYLGYGTHANRPAFGTLGRIYVETDTGSIFYDTSAAWVLEMPAFTGAVTKPVNSLVTTLSAGAVGTSNMANFNAYSVLGNATGVSAAPNYLTGAAMYGTVLPNFVASGGSAAAGIVPQPPGTAGTVLYLREDATWAGVFVASGASHNAGLVPDPGGSSGSTRFLREDATWDVPPGGGGAVFYPNLFRNSGMVVAQRATQTLSTSPLIGSVDGWAVWVSTGTTSAGTITQYSPAGTIAPVGQTGYALWLSGYTVAGVAVISIRQRIESREAVRLKNQTASLSFNVYQDTGTTVNVQINVYSANAQDNFSGTTLVSSSSAVGVLTGTPTVVSFANVSMTAACANGIEVDITFATGAQTTKNIGVTEAEITYGSSAQTYQYVEFAQELEWCRRYFNKSFAYGTAPAQNAGTSGVVTGSARTLSALWSFGVGFPCRMRANPAITLYNPSAANAQARDVTVNADCTATGAGLIGDMGFTVTYNTAVTSSGGDTVAVHYAADADNL